MLTQRKEYYHPTQFFQRLSNDGMAFCSSGLGRTSGLDGGGGENFIIRKENY